MFRSQSQYFPRFMSEVSHQNKMELDCRNQTELESAYLFTTLHIWISFHQSGFRSWDSNPHSFLPLLLKSLRDITKTRRIACFLFPLCLFNKSILSQQPAPIRNWLRASLLSVQFFCQSSRPSFSRRSYRFVFFTYVWLGTFLSSICFRRTRLPPKPSFSCPLFDVSTKLRLFRAILSGQFCCGNCGDEFGQIEYNYLIPV